jgi:hypothetical protein
MPPAHADRHPNWFTHNFVYRHIDIFNSRDCSLPIIKALRRQSDITTLVKTATLYHVSAHKILKAPINIKSIPITTTMIMSNIFNAMKNGIQGRTAGNIATRRGTQTGTGEAATQNTTRVASAQTDLTDGPIHATLKRSPSSWDLLALDVSVKTTVL